MSGGRRAREFDEGALQLAAEEKKLRAVREREHILMRAEELEHADLARKRDR